MIFKLLSAFVFVLATAESRTVLEIKQWMLNKALSCSSEAPVSNTELQLLLAHKMPDSKSAKCFIACVFKKVEWLDAEGKYDEAKVKQFSEEEYANDATKQENAKKLYEMCNVVKELTDGPEGCERAYRLAKCLLENSAKVGFQVDII